MPNGPLAAVGIGNSVMSPAVVMRPICCLSVLGEPEIAVGTGGDSLA